MSDQLSLWDTSAPTSSLASEAGKSPLRLLSLQVGNSKVFCGRVHALVSHLVAQEKKAAALTHGTFGQFGLG